MEHQPTDMLTVTQIAEVIGYSTRHTRSKIDDFAKEGLRVVRMHGRGYKRVMYSDLVAWMHRRPPATQGLSKRQKKAPTKKPAKTETGEGNIFRNKGNVKGRGPRNAQKTPTHGGNRSAGNNKENA